MIYLKDLTSIQGIGYDQLNHLFHLAKEIKGKRQKGVNFKPLSGKTVITSFPPTSLRTRVSFETGIFQLGAQSLNMLINFEDKEPVEDKVGYLNNWIDYLVIRHSKQGLIEKIAGLAGFSVVNAMSSKYHPCEILGDLQTIQELRGDLASLKFVFVGEGANISNSWFNAAAKLDLNLTQVCPKGYEVEEEIFEYAKAHSKGEVKITENIEIGLENADIVLTDGWPVDKQDQEGFNKFKPYTITLEKIKIANKDCLVNPCPPFTRGQEVAEEVIKSKYFIGYQAKENLLYMQEAILASLKPNKTITQW